MFQSRQRGEAQALGPIGKEEQRDGRDDAGAQDQQRARKVDVPKGPGPGLMAPQQKSHGDGREQGGFHREPVQGAQR